MLFRLVHATTILGLTGLSPLLVASTAAAVEAGAGLALVEQGDDRTSPGAVLHVGLNKDWAGRFYYYGETFGPVRQDTFILSGYRRWPLFKTNFLTANLGAVVMDEKTALTFDGAASSENETENNFNAGMTFGISAAWPKGPVYAAASWESHIFPAGLLGGLTLSSGRKQFLSLAVGVEFR